MNLFSGTPPDYKVFQYVYPYEQYKLIMCSNVIMSEDHMFINNNNNNNDKYLYSTFLKEVTKCFTEKNNYKTTEGS